MNIDDLKKSIRPHVEKLQRSMAEIDSNCKDEYIPISKSEVTYILGWLAVYREADKGSSISQDALQALHLIIDEVFRRRAQDLLALGIK